MMFVANATGIKLLMPITPFMNCRLDFPFALLHMIPLEGGKTKTKVMSHWKLGTVLKEFNYSLNRSSPIKYKRFEEMFLQ